MDSRDAAIDTLNKLQDWLEAQIAEAETQAERASWQDDEIGMSDAYSRAGAFREILRFVQPDGDDIPF